MYIHMLPYIIFITTYVVGNKVINKGLYYGFRDAILSRMVTTEIYINLSIYYHFFTAFI